jgi:hypothetical protein
MAVLPKKRIELLQRIMLFYGKSSVRINNSQAYGIVLYREYQVVSIKYAPKREQHSVACNTRECVCERNEELKCIDLMQ